MTHRSIRLFASANATEAGDSERLLTYSGPLIKPPQIVMIVRSLCEESKESCRHSVAGRNCLRQSFWRERCLAVVRDAGWSITQGEVESLRELLGVPLMRPADSV